MHTKSKVYGRTPFTLLALLALLAFVALCAALFAYSANSMLSSPSLSKAMESIAFLALLLLWAYFFKGFALFVEVGEKELVVGFPFRRERITGIKEARVEIPRVRRGVVHMKVRIIHSRGSTVLNFLNDFKDGKEMVRGIEKLSGKKAETFIVGPKGPEVKLAKPWQDA